MKILPVTGHSISNNQHINNDLKNNTLKHNSKNINKLSNIYYSPTFTAAGKKHYKLNLSETELKEKTTHEHFVPITLTDENSTAYKSLADGDKKALKHLIKAGEYMQSVEYKLDNPNNIGFENYLRKEIINENPNAYLTYQLFNGQKGIIGKDTLGDTVILEKHAKPLPGKGFYPEGLSFEEFHKIIKNMLNNGETDEVRKILNQRTVVVRDGNKLKAIDYTQHFKKEFTQIATELEKAAKYSTNPQFAEFLSNQAAALKINDPMLDCKADKLWAKMQDTPLEFTIGRECYNDEMTPSVMRNPELVALLEKHGIKAYAKDNLGTRTGIIDKEGTKFLSEIKKYLPYMASKMPFNQLYEQNINTAVKSDAAMVDVDIAHVSGIFAEYRGAISIASNLPNGDKLAVQTGGGRRTVYHKQMRNAKFAGETLQNRLNLLLNPTQHKYFSNDGIHNFTILHENVHSLGPKTNLEKLGTYKNTIEEFKADTGAFVMFKELSKVGFYTEKQVKEGIISYIAGYVPKGHDIKNAHRICDLMQFNKFLSNGGIKVSETGVMSVNVQKVLQGAREMLADAIKIQLSQDANIAKEYIEKNTKWSKTLEMLSQNLRAADKRLNSYIISPLLKSIK